MDDFFFIMYIYIYYSWYLEWLCFACIARQIFFADDIQIDAQMRQPGFQVVAYWLEAKCLLHLSIGMCYDLLMHVSALIGPGKFHNEWTV